MPGLSYPRWVTSLRADQQRLADGRWFG